MKQDDGIVFVTFAVDTLHVPVEHSWPSDQVNKVTPVSVFVYHIKINHED